MPPGIRLTSDAILQCFQNVRILDLNTLCARFLDLTDWRVSFKKILLYEFMSQKIVSGHVFMKKKNDKIT